MSLFDEVVRKKKTTKASKQQVQQVRKHVERNYKKNYYSSGNMVKDAMNNQSYFNTKPSNPKYKAWDDTLSDSRLFLTGGRARKNVADYNPTTGGWKYTGRKDYKYKPMFMQNAGTHGMTHTSKSGYTRKNVALLSDSQMKEYKRNLNKSWGQQSYNNKPVNKVEPNGMWSKKQIMNRAKLGMKMSNPITAVGAIGQAGMQGGFKGFMRVADALNTLNYGAHGAMSGFVDGMNNNGKLDKGELGRAFSNAKSRGSKGIQRGITGKGEGQYGFYDTLKAFSDDKKEDAERQGKVFSTADEKKRLSNLQKWGLVGDIGGALLTMNEASLGAKATKLLGKEGGTLGTKLGGRALQGLSKVAKVSDLGIDLPIADLLRGTGKKLNGAKPLATSFGEIAPKVTDRLNYLGKIPENEVVGEHIINSVENQINKQRGVRNVNHGIKIGGFEVMSPKTVQNIADNPLNVPGRALNSVINGIKANRRTEAYTPELMDKLINKGVENANLSGKLHYGTGVSDEVAMDVQTLARQNNGTSAEIQRHNWANQQVLKNKMGITPRHSVIDEQNLLNAELNNTAYDSVRREHSMDNIFDRQMANDIKTPVSPRVAPIVQDKPALQSVISKITNANKPMRMTEQGSDGFYDYLEKNNPSMYNKLLGEDGNVLDANIRNERVNTNSGVKAREQQLNSLEEQTQAVARKEEARKKASFINKVKDAKLRENNAVDKIMNILDGNRIKIANSKQRKFEFGQSIKEFGDNISRKAINHDEIQKTIRQLSGKDISTSAKRDAINNTFFGGKEVVIKGAGHKDLNEFLKAVNEIVHVNKVADHYHATGEILPVKLSEQTRKMLDLPKNKRINIVGGRIGNTDIKTPDDLLNEISKRLDYGSRSLTDNRYWEKQKLLARVHKYDKKQNLLDEYDVLKQGVKELETKYKANPTPESKKQLMDAIKEKTSKYQIIKDRESHYAVLRDMTENDFDNYISKHYPQHMKGMDAYSPKVQQKKLIEQMDKNSNKVYEELRDNTSKQYKDVQFKSKDYYGIDDVDDKTMDVLYKSYKDGSLTAKDMTPKERRIIVYKSQIEELNNRGKLDDVHINRANGGIETKTELPDGHIDNVRKNFNLPKTNSNKAKIKLSAGQKLGELPPVKENLAHLRKTIEQEVKLKLNNPTQHAEMEQAFKQIKMDYVNTLRSLGVRDEQYFHKVQALQKELLGDKPLVKMDIKLLSRKIGDTFDEIHNTKITPLDVAQSRFERYAEKDAIKYNNSNTTKDFEKGGKKLSKETKKVIKAGKPTEQQRLDALAKLNERLKDSNINRQTPLDNLVDEDGVIQQNKYRRPWGYNKKLQQEMDKVDNYSSEYVPDGDVKTLTPGAKADKEVPLSKETRRALDSMGQRRSVNVRGNIEGKLKPTNPYIDDKDVSHLYPVEETNKHINEDGEIIANLTGKPREYSDEIAVTGDKATDKKIAKQMKKQNDSNRRVSAFNEDEEVAKDTLLRMNPSKNKLKDKKGNILDKILKPYDFLTREFKVGVTKNNPGWHMMNAVQNKMNSGYGIGSGIFDGTARKQGKMVSDAIQGQKQWMGKNVGKAPMTDEELSNVMINDKYSLKDIKDIAEMEGLVDDTFMNDLGKAKGKLGQYILPSGDRSIWGGLGASNLVRTESYDKMQHLISKLKQGSNTADAVDSVNRTLFDYDAITKGEKEVMKRIMPFYTYYRKNIPLQLQQSANSPRAMATYMDAKHQFEKGIADEDKQRRDEWTANRLQVPDTTMEEKGRPDTMYNMMYNPSTPWDALMQLPTPSSEGINNMPNYNPIAESLIRYYGKGEDMFGNKYKDDNKGILDVLAEQYVKPTMGVSSKYFDVKNANSKQNAELEMLKALTGVKAKYYKSRQDWDFKDKKDEKPYKSKKKELVRKYKR